MPVNKRELAEFFLVIILVCRAPFSKLGKVEGEGAEGEILSYLYMKTRKSCNDKAKKKTSICLHTVPINLWLGI